MYESWDRPHNVSTRTPFEKSFINTPRNPLNFWRRPSFSFSRGSTMAGRYPNMSLRHYAPTVHRSNYPMSRGTSVNLIYPKPNPPIGVVQPFVQRPTIYYMPRNTFDNKNNQCMQTSAHFNGNQVTVESNEQKNETSKLNAFSDLWVESLAPGGRIYYYNTRTRESTWVKPINVRIIEINEIKQLTAHPELEKSEKLRKENSDQNLQQQPINNSYAYPNNYSVPPNFIIFPPNLLTPPPNFRMPPPGNSQKIANYDIKFMIPPPVLQFPVIAQNLMPNTIINECRAEVSQNLLPNNNIIKYNSNNTQNMLLGNEANLITKSEQNMLSNVQRIQCDENEMQMCLSLQSENKTIKQNIFLKNKVIDYSSSDSEKNSNSEDENDRKTIEFSVIKNEKTNINTSKSSKTFYSSSSTEVNKSYNRNLIIKQNIFPKNQIIDYSSSDSERNIDSETEDDIKTLECAVVKNEKMDISTPNLSETFQPLSSTEETEDDRKTLECAVVKNEKMDISTPNLSETFQPLSSTEVNISNDASENAVQNKNEKLVHLISKNDHTLNTKSDNSVISETKSISFANICKENPINKSRPVSSTPIPGTCWCVVWTGDERVFFYDSHRRVSVWERPTELLNRNDVDKLIEKPPLPLDFKQLTKETRKNTCDPSYMSKKQRKDDDENSENSKVKKTAEIAKVENISVVKNVSEEDEKPTCDNYSHEQKIEMFREMLSDKKISISSTWEKEVQKIVFDSRYLLLPVEERKQVFEDYIKNKLENPIELLNSRNVDTGYPKSPLDLKSLTEEPRKNPCDHSDETKKQAKDDENSKYKKTNGSSNTGNICVVENSSEIEEKFKCNKYSHEQRIQMFCEMLSDKKISIFSTWEKEVQKIVFDSRYLLLDVEERRQVFNDYIRKLQEDVTKRQKENQQKESFLYLLEEAGLTSKSLFRDIAHSYSEDVRFKAIEEMGLKESIFNQYISKLKEKETQKSESELKRDFIELSENNCKKFPGIQNISVDDKRHETIQSTSFKENLLKEYSRENCLKSPLFEKHKSIDTNMKNSKENISHDLSVHQKNQVKEEENHEYTLAVSHFKALLEDLIEDSGLNWEATKSILKVDKRWNCALDLGPEKCEELFHEFTNAKKKDQFRSLLDELPDLTMKTSWLDIRKDVLKDPRCAKFSSCERKCEKEFKEYLRCKRSRAKMELKQLLKETKLITSKSKSLLDCSDHLNDIEKVLSQDKRYLNLDCMRSTRKLMILSYINKL